MLSQAHQRHFTLVLITYYPGLFVKYDPIKKQFHFPAAFILLLFLYCYYI